MNSSPLRNDKNPDDTTVPQDAFLVVQGGNAVPLDKSLITIGRGLDNDVVLDDPRISRHHAKICIIRDRFVLIDLDSSGGSFINGIRVNRQILLPGDLISLAGLILVFMQNSGLRKHSTDPLSSPGPGERSTAVLDPSESEEEEDLGEQ